MSAIGFTMTIIILLIVLVFSLIGTLLITASFVFCVMSFKLNQSIRLGADGSDVKAVKRTPLHIIYEEEFRG